MTSLKTVNNFLGKKRLAIVGVSRNEADFSRGLFREFQKQGYDVVPVNPGLTQVEGLTCYPSVEHITPPVEGVLIMTAPAVTNQVVEDCARAGVKLVWMHKGGGSGAVSQTAIAFCQKNGIEVIEGQCPYMFLPSSSGFVHRIHATVKKLTGSYPR
ncbi:MAG: CoA-binding protein [Chloroflexota bacterium]|nr:CoA-binding protein [Chloroflexota bacterium]